MLHELLHTNRVELTARCRAKVAARSSPAPAQIDSAHHVLDEGGREVEANGGAASLVFE